MRKNKIIITAGLVVLLIVAVFVWVIFSKKKTMQVSVQNPVVESQETEAASNQQKAVSSQQQTEGSTQQNIENKSQANTETKSSDEKIVNKFISWGFQKSSGRKIDTIIIHSTYDAIGNDPYSIDGIIAEYKQYGVSAHYLIGRDGTIYHLVADQNIAYHAGVS